MAIGPKKIISFVSSLILGVGLTVFIVFMTSYNTKLSFQEDSSLYIKKGSNLNKVIKDLKNDFGIPIASGLYIIHVNAPGIGEKVIKWFGALRPIDLDTF